MSARLSDLVATLATIGLLILIALAGFLFTFGLWKATPQPTLLHVTINGAVSAASIGAILVGLVRRLKDRTDRSFLIWAVVLSLAAHCVVLLAAMDQQA